MSPLDKVPVNTADSRNTIGRRIRESVKRFFGKEIFPSWIRETTKKAKAKTTPTEKSRPFAVGSEINNEGIKNTGRRNNIPVRTM